MGDLFWHPTRELSRLPNGWKMMRRGRRHSEGAIVPEGDELVVYIRDGNTAVRIGSARTLSAAATLLWNAP